MSPQPISLALVGCGAVAHSFYAPTIKELVSHDLVRVTAVVDPVANARNTLAHTLKAQACAHLAEALALKPTLVIIASPPRFHLDQAREAFAAGCDVLCEKPLARTTAECRALCAAAASADRILAAGHYKRFMPVHRAIKTMIDQHTFGPLHRIEIVEGGKFSWPAATDSFFRKEQTPGGVLLDIGVHLLDLLGWWLDQPTHFTYSDDALDGLEANCQLNATFQGGVTASVRLSRDWETENVYIFHFDKATIHSRVNASNKLELTLAGLPLTLAAELRDPLPPHPSPPTAPLETNPQAFIAQLVDVCESVRDRRPPFVSGEDATQAIEWIENCYARRTPLKTY